MDENKNKPFGNKDETEKNRELTKAEQERLAHFEAVSDDLIQKGYKRTDLTVGIVKGNLFAVILFAVAAIIGVGVFYLVHRDLTKGVMITDSPLGSLMIDCILLLPVIIVLTVLHELIHGASWAIFAEHHFKDIRFGLIKKYLTPYCNCLSPLSRGQYIFGSLMPTIVLGIIPMIVAIAIGSMPILMIGILMTTAGGGDILCTREILRYKTKAETVLYIDHPTQVGGVIFEK